VFVVAASRDALLKLLEPEVLALGYELTDIEVRLGNGRGLLRLYIEDPIPDDYNLEVSSPGMNRKLVKPAHFEQFAGRIVKVKLHRLVNGRRNVKGVLIGLDGDEILVREDEEDIRLPLADVDVARVVPE
jgi:ribosome maturation factor RimP